MSKSELTKAELKKLNAEAKARKKKQERKKGGK